MRWFKSRDDEKAVREGKRTVRRFAFLPTEVDADDADYKLVVWFEWYYAQQEFQYWAYGFRWVTIARYAYDPLIDPALAFRSEGSDA